jgi:ketosteroid isomerase-like protein
MRLVTAADCTRRVQQEEWHGMSEALNRRTVERLFKALIEGDLESFHDQFHEDSLIDFPQSGERISGGENRRAVYREFPGRPSLRRILTGGDLVLVEAAVEYGDGVDWRAIFIYELRDAKIARATIYWAQPFEAAESRAAWVVRMDV